jgi:hemolysin-activating ACP:hemolysin acyltransferase
MKYFRMIRSLDVAPLLAEIEAHEQAWLLDTSRQDKLAVQRHTNTIFLKSAVKRPDLSINDNQESEFAPIAAHFPLAVNLMASIAADEGGALSRATIVRLKPKLHVGRHIDGGSYYRIRDRYHLVLRSEAGSVLRSGDEEVRMRLGELWWFDNKQHHSAINEGEEWRIHCIFDVLPDAYRHLAVNPLPASRCLAEVAAPMAAAGQLGKQAAAVPTSTLASAFAEVMWLLSQSARHKALPVSELQSFVMAPLQLGQCRLFHVDGKPAGAALWAFVGEAADQRLRSGAMRLEAQEWRSGDRLWLVDLIAPFGQGPQMLRELKARVFPDRELTFRRVDGAGSVIQSL